MERIFPFLNEDNPFFKKMLEENLQKMEYGPEKFIARQDDESAYLPFVYSGSVRVFLSSENGKEITLYRIDPGETCILTAFSLLNHKSFPANAITESDCQIYLLHSKIVEEWMSKYDFWRNYIFSVFQKRIDLILATINEIVFERMDLRLLKYIVQLHEKHGNNMTITHQSIANELGTAREVISRLLKDFEQKKWIKLSRGTIEILDIIAIKNKLDDLLQLM